MVFRRSNSAPLDPSPIEVTFKKADPIVTPLDPSPARPADHPEPAEPPKEEKSKSTDNVSDGTEGSENNRTAAEDSQGKGRGWGRGFILDFQNTVGRYWCVEMKNFNQKTIAVSFFLFFACIAPAITFGAVYSKATKNRIGAVEMLIATAACGIIYALIGGQPLMINGGTGPVLAFTEIIFKLSERLEVPFLTFNAWICIWVGVYMFAAAFCGMNRVIDYATRFTDEIFALLIAMIFIINALGHPFSPTGIYYYFESSHKSHEPFEDDEKYSHTATALLSLLICLGTVQMAFSLRRAKFSPFLPSQTLRNTVTDFAVVASVVFWTIVAAWAFDDVELERLNVPDSVAPTFACCTDTCDSSWPEDCLDLLEPARRRDWLVDLFDLDGKSYVPLMAAGPALLAFILVFLDDGITWHLINHPAHKLTHGAAYDYDTVIIGIMVVVNGLFGLPVLVAATVRSLNHVHALAEKDPSGKIKSVQETRLTHLFIHMLVLASLFALEALKLIPMPVLYGVFLFMGLVSLGSNTLWNRFLMFFMQPTKYPLEPYTMHIKPHRMHLFTAIQLGLFVLLYAVKSIKMIAIAFPLVIACCIPIRLYLLPRIFTEKELVMIDSDDSEIMRWLASHGEAGSGEDKTEVGGIDETHHRGERGEFDVMHAKIEPPAPEVVEGGLLDDEMGEQVDQLHPLPAGEVRTPRRARRKKSVSCPTPHLMFTEVPLGATPDIALAVVHEDAHSETASEELEATATPLRRRRPRRTKQLSCPTHLLVAQADRHMSENYFFG